MMMYSLTVFEVRAELLPAQCILCLLQFYLAIDFFGGRCLSEMASLVSTVIKDAFIALCQRGCLIAGTEWENMNLCTQIEEFISWHL